KDGPSQPALPGWRSIPENKFILTPLLLAESTLMFKTSDGCPIAYTVHSAPNAPRMVLIHSLALDSSVWDGVVARLAWRAEILTLDCRGHGRSGREAGRFTTDLFARDLAELLDHVGWQKVILGGCSMGG